MTEKGNKKTFKRRRKNLFSDKKRENTKKKTVKLPMIR